MLAYLLEIDKIYTIGYKSYKGKKQTQLKLIKKLKLSDKKILLVDDLSDTGKTLKRAFNDLQTPIYLLHNYISSATLYYKKDTKFLPNFTVKQINDWIQFPWEL